MRSFIGRLVREDEGQDLIEYTLLAAFVALGSVGALIVLGPAILGLFNTIVQSLSQAGAGASK